MSDELRKRAENLLDYIEVEGDAEGMIDAMLAFRAEGVRELRGILQAVRDHIKYDANSDGGIVAQIDHVLAHSAGAVRIEALERLRSWVNTTLVALRAQEQPGVETSTKVPLPAGRVTAADPPPAASHAWTLARDLRALAEGKP